MKTHNWTFTASGTSYEADLSTGQGIDQHISGLCFDIADFDIEVVGNASAVTLSATGPFPTSAPFEVADGEFAADGGKKAINDFTVRVFTFDHAGGGTYTVNITRRIRN